MEESKEERMHTEEDNVYGIREEAKEKERSAYSLQNAMHVEKKGASRDSSKQGQKGGDKGAGKGKGFQGTCQICGVFGHSANNCW